MRQMGLGIRGGPTVLVLIALLPTAVAGDSQAPEGPRRTVSWEVVRDSLERSCCMDGTPARYAPTWLDRKGCESVYGAGGEAEINDVVDRVGTRVLEERLQVGIHPRKPTPCSADRWAFQKPVCSGSMT